MYTVKETIIVEGIYDKIKLSGFIDSLIFVTGGFSVMNNKATQKAICTLAEKNGIVILTDSDRAGIKIRNFVKQLVPKEKVKHAYVPEIHGKERRKTSYSKEGLLGVEGIDDEIVMKALRDCGCSIDGDSTRTEHRRKITKADFYALGLSGGEESSEKRSRLAKELGLPSKLSANMLLDSVNLLLDMEELKKMLAEI